MVEEERKRKRKEVEEEEEEEETLFQSKRVVPNLLPMKADRKSLFSSLNAHPQKTHKVFATSNACLILLLCSPSLQLLPLSLSLSLSHFL